jgi:hypothetical protein
MVTDVIMPGMNGRSDVAFRQKPSAIAGLAARLRAVLDRSD